MSTLIAAVWPSGWSGLAGLWDRKLPHYPETGPRSLYLAITVLATVVLYYELYIAGAVATQIIAEFGFSFTVFVFVSVIGNAVGAFASLFAGLADRWGRANLVVGGLLITGLIIAFGLPNAPNKAVYMAALRRAELRRGHRAGRHSGADPRLLPAGRPRRGHGLLDPRSGARQPRGHRGPSHTLDSHPGLALPVPRLRDRRLVVFRSRWSACASSPPRCATSSWSACATGR